MRPRPLNRLDSRLLRLQTPTRPWVICLRAHTESRVSQDEVAAAIRRPPWALDVWCPRLGDGDGGGLVWRPASGGWPEVGSGPLDADLDRGFHLRHESPIRVTVVPRGPGSTVQLAVNHAYTDGRGTLALLRAVMGSLAGRESPEPPVLGDGHLDRLPRRGPVSTGLIGARLAAHGARRVASLGLDELDATTTAAETIPLDRIDRRRAPESASTVNDLAVTATHVALRELIGPARATSVGVPIDLRPIIDAPPGLGNAVVSISTVSKPGDRPMDLEAIDLGIRLRAAADPPRLGSLLAVMTRLSRPGEPRPRSRRGPAWPETAVCSNLGRLADDPSWVGVERIDFSPPAHLVPAVGLVTVHGSLSVMARLRGPQDLAARLASRVASLLRGATQA